jgi:hypothetical protein
VAFAADVEKLQTQYQGQLDALSKAGQAKFGFVDYDPPTFVVVSKQMVLKMTMKMIRKKCRCTNVRR